MATVTFDSWFNEVLPDVPGCAPEVALNAIRNSAIDFCEQSRAWIYEHPGFAYQANVGTYPLSVPTGTKIHEILWMWDVTSNREIWPRNPAILARLYLNWRTQTGTPLYYTTLDADVSGVTVVPMPITVGAGVTLICGLKPTRDSLGIDEKFFAEYMEGIACGAKGRLMMQPGKRYTEASLAPVLMARARSLATDAYNRTQSGLGKDTGVRFRLPQWLNQ